MFVEGKSRTVFFPSDTLIYGISRDGSKNFNIRICEHMILGQLSMGVRQTKNAPLLIYMWSQENGFPHVWVIYFRLCVIYVQAGWFVWCAKRASAVYWHLWYWVSTINWIGRKGHLQFIGFLGHYFTPDLAYAMRSLTLPPPLPSVNVLRWHLFHCIPPQSITFSRIFQCHL